MLNRLRELQRAEDELELGKRRKKGLPGGSEDTHRPLLRTLRRAQSGRNRVSKAGRNTGSALARKASSQHLQRVIVKAHISRHTRRSKVLSNHLAYLQREGVGRDGGTPSMVSHDGKVDRETVLNMAKEWSRDRHHFRFIISPENGSLIDLEKYAKSVVLEMEKDLKTGLEWLATVHYNTDNPHIHLVVRGKKQDGHDLVIPKHYKNEGLRIAAQEIATRELGYRTEHELLETLQRDVSKERLVGIDRMLLKEQNESVRGHVDLRVVPSLRNHRALEMRRMKLTRLSYLKELGLAKETTVGIWSLREDTEEVLRKLGKKRDVIVQMHEGGRIMSKERLVIVDRKEGVIPEVEGYIVARGIADELYDRRSVTIAAKDGQQYYFELSKGEEKALAFARVGAAVSITRERRSIAVKADSNVVRIAQGGVYDIAHHRSLCEGNKPEVKLPKHINIDEYLERHVLRLNTLETHGIVKQISRTQWQLIDGFSEKIKVLQQKQQEQLGRADNPHFTVVSYLSLNEQIQARGLTWLDVRLAEARSSFDPTEEKASVARREVLSERAFLENGKVTVATLEKLYAEEVKGLTAKVSGVKGEAVVLTQGERLRGRVVTHVPSASGLHAVVQGRHHYAVVPIQKNAYRLGIGKIVEVKLTAQDLGKDKNKELSFQPRIVVSSLERGRKKRVEQSRGQEQ